LKIEQRRCDMGAVGEWSSGIPLDEEKKELFGDSRKELYGEICRHCKRKTKRISDRETFCSHCNKIIK